MSSGARLSRDDWKKQRDLEEARKAGTAPAEIDEDGKEINPHIPQYIAVAPWYLNKEKPGLKHQKAFNAKQDYDKEWYLRGAKAGPAATKYRKGACKNCGAMTHNEKVCTERPRKVGAKWTGKDIQPDEVVKDLNLDFDGKRDRWNGYDASTWSHLLDKHEKTEQERRRRKKEEELNKLTGQSEANGATTEAANGAAVESDSDSDSSSDEEKEDFLDKEDQSVGVKKDPRTRTTVRNLRIREDTAKYLRNLDPNSAHYDPKSRSMRENPNPNAKADEQLYAGDNFVRQSGEVLDFMKVQTYAFQAHERGSEIHLQAAPSQAELLFKDYQKKKEELSKKHKEEILQKYGGEQYLQAPPKQLLLAQTEEYVEYSADGSILKGGENVIPKSKYEEDVYIGNHKSVWGSYWEDGQWGYACCHQVVKNSYCTGKEGIVARDEINKDMRDQKSLLEQKLEKGNTGAKKTEEQERKEKLEKALQAEEERAKRVEKDERKRQYNSASGDTYDVTEEEFEAYNLKKKRWDDPLTAMQANEKRFK